MVPFPLLVSVPFREFCVPTCHSPLLSPPPISLSSVVVGEIESHWNHTFTGRVHLAVLEACKSFLFQAQFIGSLGPFPFLRRCEAPSFFVFRVDCS